MEPDQLQKKSSDVTTKRETYEVFRYRVVYPGGTFLRISPATDAEQTGSILEFGTIFDASKSLFLDGINYAKLSDGSGWVFESKNDVRILELLQIIRVPCKSIIKGNSTEEPTPSKSVPVSVIPHQSFSALVGNRAGVAESVSHSPPQERCESHDGLRNKGSVPTQKQKAKVENRLWRDVRARCGACRTFEEFLQLVTTLKISIEGLHSPHEQRVLDSITLIASITGQCSGHIVKQGKDLVRVGACLWVLVHMGSRISHTMALIVDLANQIFESASNMKKANLLRVVLEVGTRTKSHTADLARQVDILPDDIRNFLQRWIIVQSLDEVKESISTADEGVPLGPKEHHRSKRTMSKYGSCSHDIETENFRVRSTPLAEKVNLPSNGKWTMYIPNVTSWCSSLSPSSSSSSSSSFCFLPNCPARGPVGSDVDESDRRHDNRRYIRDTRKMDSNMSLRGADRGRGRGVTLESDTATRGPQSLSNMIWNEIEKQAEKFVDIDMQLAGLI